MNGSVRPQADSSLAAHREDPDALFRAFFQAERPESWPTAPRVVVAPSRRRWKRATSRLALAASVGLLLIGSWALINRLKLATPDAPVQGLGPTARPILPPGSPPRLPGQAPTFPR